MASLRQGKALMPRHNNKPVNHYQPDDKLL